MTVSCLYVGEVTHKRTQPVTHVLRYPESGYPAQRDKSHRGAAS